MGAAVAGESESEGLDERPRRRFRAQEQPEHERPAANLHHLLRDVDTVATIALAAGAHSQEIAQDLPENLVMTLENRQYGCDYLAALDKQLLSVVRAGGA